ncbi:methyltransferase type 11 [Reticulomyxa filosa]|uniref:Methyltransferase type 11 n=1 Tax=Reticulomyxa filosa TaxID=46433 RepID=X6N4P9_RETFI|nr:methyltransferase type 11 [Reticulomyxa filosa]|eukprot:ETO20297.1 methyltransferase type 11 [Reticulomyxa filosa]
MYDDLNTKYLKNKVAVPDSPNGYGIGVDKWDVFGQVGICRSNYEQCLYNAKLYHVDDRMKLISGSVLRVSTTEFKDAEFDVVVTSWFLHIIDDCYKQTRILDEIIRILKPKGHLLFIDIWNATTIQDYLQQTHNCSVISSPWLPIRFALRFFFIFLKIFLIIKSFFTIMFTLVSTDPCLEFICNTFHLFNLLIFKKWLLILLSLAIKLLLKKLKIHMMKKLLFSCK